MSAGTYTLYCWRQGSSSSAGILGYITITVGSGGGGSGSGGGAVIVPSASCTITWSELSSYPGDRVYSSSSIHNLTGA